MPSPEVTTNFFGSDGLDLGKKLITKDYLMSVYPQIASQLITPELWIWGDGADGRLGANVATNRSTPVTTFAGGANWKQVSGGYRHTAAIKTDGTLWLWGGNNAFAELGTNDGTTTSTPVTTFAGGINWKQISAATTGKNSFCSAIKTDGTLWVWGNSQSGQLGTNNTIVAISTPVTTFAGGTNWKQVSCGTLHTAAIKTDGTLWVWGSNNLGKLGINDAIQEKVTPVTTFAGGTNWKQVSCGGEHTAAIKTDGTLWIWGGNSAAQLGTNNGTTRSTPVTTFAGSTNWKQVSCAYRFTSTIKTDGTLWVWGRNTSTQLGINSGTNRSTPVTTFAGGTNWKQVSAGYTHSTAIKTSDDLIGL